MNGEREIGLGTVLSCVDYNVYVYKIRINLCYNKFVDV